MSPVVTWALRFAAAAGLGLALPALPAPVRPFIVLFGLFAAWALAANDLKKDERNDRPDVRELQGLPTPARARYRPRRVQAAKP